MNKLLLLIIGVALVCMFSATTRIVPAHAQTRTVTVQVDKPGAQVSGKQIGIFFEDINFGADGGLYAELVKNRSFEFPQAMMGWARLERGSTGSLNVMTRESVGNNNYFMRVKAESATGGFGLTNGGFRGLGISKGETYNFSVQARTAGKPVNLRVELVSANGQKLAEAVVKIIAADWKQYAAPMAATETDAKAQLNVIVEGGGTVDLDMISLFPKTTWKGRPNGLRPDLVQLLADLKPGFLRFPGGCIVEGRELETRYQWKTTIGEVDQRKLIVNRWNTEFKSRNPARAAEDYYQSFGVGFYEYFQLCEDIGAEPLPIINCGMACQFNTKELAPLDQLDPYIQDALDLIEFANGSVVTPWGRKRAAMGHPAPFNMKMLGVGNEQWGPEYIERYEIFAKALKAKHPKIKLITSAGPDPADDRFRFLWDKLRELKADIVDEHYYKPPQWFYDNVNRYDSYPRTGPKVFAGEYAAHARQQGRPDTPNTWEAALAEAALMTGLERNADVVEMASYAPLFGHVDAWQWSPNLIWFDNLRSFGTPSYYVQKLFGQNQGSTLLPVLLDGLAKNGQQNLYASAERDTKTGEVILKLVNSAATQSEVRINLAGVKRIEKAGKAVVLASADLKAENSLDVPRKVVPTEQPLGVKTPEFSYTLAPQSLTVLRLNCATK